MSDDLDLSAARSPTIGSVLQAATLACLLGGGYVGKEAYEDLRDELVQTRIEAAAMRTAMEGLAGRSSDTASELISIRARLEELQVRVAHLEALTTRGKR